MKAEAAINHVLGALEEGAWRYDPWVNDCMAHALGAHYRGLYDLARVEAKHAMVPVVERSRAKAPYSPPMSVEQMRRAFTTLSTYPVRQHPVFG